ncbi:MAG: tautomerase family protein [Pseudomonadota bacterium]
MPSIEIQVLEGVFDADEKARIIRHVTKAFGEAAGGDMAANTSVRILEVKSGNWGFGGEVLTAEVGHRIKATKPSTPGG